MRLQCLNNLQEYHFVTGERTGLHVLTNTSFDDGRTEAVRFNLDQPTSSCRRSGVQAGVFPRQRPPFDILSPSLLISVEQLNGWRDNFASVHDAAGEQSLGNIPQNAPANDVILQGVQACSFEIAHIDEILRTLPVETALYSSYQAHPRQIGLIQDTNLTPDGSALLQHFGEAVSVYSRVPELRRYSIQDEAVEGGPGPRGRQFQQWLAQGHSLPIGDGFVLEYVAHELKPLHLSGGDFRWNQNHGDLRLVSVDLLCRYRKQPVWCEVKMAGDTWTSSAVLQILFYGSMLSSGHQRRRLARCFPDQFENTRPWLGVVAERRDNADFLPDYRQAIAFAEHQAVCEVLRPQFGGLIFVLLQPENEGWGVVESTIVRW